MPKVENIILVGAVLPWQQKLHQLLRNGISQEDAVYLGSTQG